VRVRNTHHWRDPRNEMWEVWQVFGVLGFVLDEILLVQEGKGLDGTDIRRTKGGKRHPLPSFSFFRRTSSSYTSVESS
jgi:hypothetical protein